MNHSELSHMASAVDDSTINIVRGISIITYPTQCLERTTARYETSAPSQNELLQQLSFHRTGSTATLVSQAEIGVWVSTAWGASVDSVGITALPEICYEIVYAKPCNLVHFGRKMVRNAVYNSGTGNQCAFLNTLTMGTAFPCVSMRSPSI